MSLDPLLLSCRAEGALVRLGCRTVDDVAALTRRQLLTAKNCGRRSVVEIDAALRRLGRALACDVRARATKRPAGKGGACVQGEIGVLQSATPEPCKEPASLPPERSKDMTLAQLPFGDPEGSGPALIAQEGFSGFAESPGGVR